VILILLLSLSPKFNIPFNKVADSKIHCLSTARNRYKSLSNLKKNGVI